MIWPRQLFEWYTDFTGKNGKGNHTILLNLRENSDLIFNKDVERYQIVDLHKYVKWLFSKLCNVKQPFEVILFI